MHCFSILLNLISSFSVTRYLFVWYAYVPIESIKCVLLLSFELKAMLLISLVKTFCLSLLNLCCVFNINLCFFRNYLLPFSKATHFHFIFSWWFISSSSWVPPKQFSLSYFFVCLLHFVFYYHNLLRNYKFLLLIHQILW